MDLSFLHVIFRRYRQIHPQCFNPCSYGSFVLTNGFPQDVALKLIVSILVLMDLSFLQKPADEIRGYSNGVSILVLMDLSFLH